MPLLSWTKNIWYNIRELKADNKKKWKARWNKGKLRTNAQILAIALSKAKKTTNK